MQVPAAMAFVARHANLFISRLHLLRHASTPLRSVPLHSVRPPTNRARLLATASPPPPKGTNATATSVAESPSLASAASAPDYTIKLLYDGDCPLCVKEVNFLRGRNDKFAPRTPIVFVDIADDGYEPSENADIDYETAMGRIHGITSDGRVLVGVEVFRIVYEKIGLGWVYAVTRLQVVGAAAEWIYGIWAERRLQLTGRPSLQEVMATREKKTCR